MLSYSVGTRFQSVVTTQRKSSSSSSTRRIRNCHPKQQQDLKGKFVAVVGIGISGTAATKLALARGASVLALDQNENLRPLEQNPIFEKHKNLKTIVGHIDNELLKDADLVVVSPGVPLENYGISKLLQSGKRVMSELDFAAEALPRRTKILAVTGTNGKSTTTTFAGQMLTHLNIKTFVGGNLGVPLSEAAFQCLTLSPDRPLFQVAVVEVSSSQLCIPHKYFCPSVASILNLTPDHLERHKTMTNYASIKCRILSNMRDNKIGLLPLGNQYLSEAVKDYENEINLARMGDFPGFKIDMEAKAVSFKLPATEGISELQLGTMKTAGAHNYSNAAVAAFSVIALEIGIDAEALASTIGELKVPPHRLQIVHKDSHGLTWVNDSKATNVESTYTGLMGLKELKSVILLGGLAKVSDMQDSNGFERLIEPLKGHRGVVTFGSSGKMIQKKLSAKGLSIPCVGATNLKDAVKLARSMAKYGDAIVLSPACASLDEFKNFEHRGTVFQELAMSGLD